MEVLQGSSVYAKELIVSYSAATAGSTLTFTYVQQSSDGNISLQAAILDGTPPNGGGNGTLNVSAPLTQGQTINLTGLNAADWLHLADGSDAEQNRRQAGGSQISDVTAVDDVTLNRFVGQAGNQNAFSWGDGVPRASATASQSMLYTSEIGGGFSLSAPAGTTSRTGEGDSSAFATRKSAADSESQYIDL